MRTWLHALPPAHHAPEAPVEGGRTAALQWQKARSGAGIGPKAPYALAKETGCPEGITARRTPRALA